MDWFTAGAMATNVVGGILSGRKASKAAKAQQEAANRVYQLFKGVKVPTLEEQQLILQNPALMGEYSPEQLQAMDLNVSAMEGVSADQSTIDSQKGALEGISEIAEGGYSESDKAVAREIQRTVSQDAQARQKSILNQMAQRGVLGSGMELAAQLQGAQQSAEQMSKGGEGLTQQSMARALQALGQQGSLSSQMRGQEFDERSSIARAQDSINEFNVRNRQRVSDSNVEGRNRAQLSNLQQKQDLEDSRANLANRQQAHNKNLHQTVYQNQMDKARQMAAAIRGQGVADANRYNQQGQMIAGITQGISGGLAGLNKKPQEEG